jgi:hypothetical protein
MLSPRREFGALSSSVVGIGQTAMASHSIVSGRRGGCSVITTPL